MKMNVSAVRLVVVTRSSGPPASRPVSTGLEGGGTLCIRRCFQQLGTALRSLHPVTCGGLWRVTFRTLTNILNNLFNNYVNNWVPSPLVCRDIAYPTLYVGLVKLLRGSVPHMTVILRQPVVPSWNLNLGAHTVTFQPCTWWRWVFSLSRPVRFAPWQKHFRDHWAAGWVEPRASVDVSQNKSVPPVGISTPKLPTRCLV
jgi:hypothetical protein